MTTTVQAVTRKQIDAEIRQALAAIYLAAYGDPSLPESQLDADNFVSSTIPRHSRRAGFRLILATTDGQASGYAYGFTGKRGQFWSDWLSGAAPADIVENWVGDHFELVDIVVDPRHRGQGIAGLLHDRLVHDLPQQKALLATTPDGGAAARLYDGRGWQVLVPEIDGAKALYGLDLADRTA
ncbi:GNAT family N-acetyltransferase [Aeromicrobium ginsengisoli]|uniref:GNAT family N-acetyltransferase n=1 Tax=Aeromicrobium ginsengisoli TaxID=363867 RepID=A0A5M4FGU3_9ACTN|nr:GNAT family N-acetyltransferase [Aeromicrobium ginsengisoli]KAA1399386.1 GNAT family N-acetyltransferase [Aeromicrobium ginsengisoli]